MGKDVLEIKKIKEQLNKYLIRQNWENVYGIRVNSIDDIELYYLPEFLSKVDQNPVIYKLRYVTFLPFYYKLVPYEYNKSNKFFNIYKRNPMESDFFTNWKIKDVLYAELRHIWDSEELITKEDVEQIINMLNKKIGLINYIEYKNSEYI
jgi:hypothetical protein